LLLAADLNYGAATLGNNSSGRTGDGSLGLARPNWDFQQLPGIEVSASLIPPLVPGSDVVLTGEQGTESAIRSYRPRVVHFATHGFFLPDRSLLVADPTSIVSFLEGDQFLGLGGITEVNPNPLDPDLLGSGLGAMVRSGLALSGANQREVRDTGDDGILTALEVTGMDLRATELVVLSACQTAEGEVKNGEGVFGLRRAFALAGAQNVLMSQWPVSDKLTLDQMEWFYEFAFPQSQPAGDTAVLTPVNANVDLAISLRQSQLNSIELLRGLFYDPNSGVAVAPVLLWAPFIIQVSGGSERPPGP
jgi:CHAT domain-containing protein